MSHLEEGLLHALLDGEIPSSELPQIQAHLESCPECRARLAAERELLAESDRLVDLVELPAPGTTPSPARVRRPPPRRWPRSVAWAATIVLAAGLGYLARGGIASAPEALRNDSGPVIANAQGDRIATRPAASRNDSGTVSPAASRKDSGRVIARERSDRGDLQTENPIASRPAASRNDSGSLSPGRVIARERSDRGDLPAQQQRVDEQRRAEASGRSAFSALRAVEKTARLPAAPVEPITFPEAVRRLGGSLRLIDGMVPLRLEAQGAEIRIVYPAAQGELVLAQQLIDGRIVVRLLAPPEFPADSLARLRARIRE